MMDYLFHITLLYSIVFTIVVGVINSLNPTLLEALKPLALAGVGLPGVTIYVFMFVYVEQVMWRLRSQRIKQDGGWFNVIALPVFVISVLAIPTLVLELVVPGRGWLIWMFIAGAVWRVVFFVFMRLHAKIRSIVVPDPRSRIGQVPESTSTKI